MQTLTEKDIEIIRALISDHRPTCQIGLTQEEVWGLRANRFTPEEISRLKKCVKAFDKSAQIIGSLIVVAIVGGFIALVTRGFWSAVVDVLKSPVVK